MQVAGKRVLLTGATGGLGEATANELATRGASLVLSGRNREALEALVASLPGEGHSALLADLAEPGAATWLVEQALAGGPVDVCIANAGLPGGGSMANLTPEAISDVIRVNLEVPVMMAQAVVPSMVERGSGQIIFIASVAGKFSLPGSTLYSGTKAGLRTVSWSLRGELKSNGVGVTAITPGFIREAGMFVKRGGVTPWFVRTRTPAQFGKAVVRAIERNPGEIVLAPLTLRAIANLAVAMPGVLVGLLGRSPAARRGN